MVLLISFLVASMLLEKILTAHMHVDYEKYSWSLGPCQLDILETCDSDHIQFYLYTSACTVRMEIPVLTDGLPNFFPGGMEDASTGLGGKDRPEPLRIQDEWPPSSFDPTARTKVLIHGYAGSLEFNGTALVRQAYLERGKYNVIVVDWGRLVRLPCYPTAVLNTWQAGKCTAELLEKLWSFQMKGFMISQIHIIGFSLGAHVAAFASNHIFARLKKKIGRITGLDPALPFFASLKSSWKLDKPDASFVDIIHTNSGVFGKIEATGHADFYVNGGTAQPACKGAYNPPLCSHIIATIYFAESVLASGNSYSKQFYGVSCPSYLDLALGRCRDGRVKAVMGESCSSLTRGLFYVETESSPPFAKG